MFITNRAWIFSPFYMKDELQRPREFLPLRLPPLMTATFFLVWVQRCIVLWLNCTRSAWLAFTGIFYSLIMLLFITFELSCTDDNSLAVYFDVCHVTFSYIWLSFVCLFFSVFVPTHFVFFPVSCHCHSDTLMHFTRPPLEHAGR